jgi:hypothetical protein
MVGGQRQAPGPLYPREREPIPIVQETGWASGPVWMCLEYLAPPGFEPRTLQPVAVSHEYLFYLILMKASSTDIILQNLPPKRKLTRLSWTPSLLEL